LTRAIQSGERDVDVAPRARRTLLARRKKTPAAISW